MSNSPLVSYTSISPNSTNPRRDKIKKITIHHMAGNLTVERCGAVFATPERQASSNYGVGSDGRVGLYVEEVNRAWTSSNAANDNEAVTIEVANDGGAPDWHVSDTALEATIELCADICRRNGIAALNYTGDASGNLTMHKWFHNTLCPGPYLESKFPYIAEQVNKRLSSAQKPQETPEASGGINTPAPTEKAVWRVQVGAFGKKENAAAMLAKLKKAGFDGFITGGPVQATGSTQAQPSTPAKKTVEEIAREVIRGAWGNGNDRTARLKAAGYDPATVQKKVNELLGK